MDWLGQSKTFLFVVLAVCFVSLAGCMIKCLPMKMDVLLCKLDSADFWINFAANIMSYVINKDYWTCSRCNPKPWHYLHCAWPILKIIRKSLLPPHLCVSFHFVDVNLGSSGLHLVASTFLLSTFSSNKLGDVGDADVTVGVFLFFINHISNIFLVIDCCRFPWLTCSISRC